MMDILVMTARVRYIALCTIGFQSAVTLLNADPVNTEAFLRLPSGQVELIGPPGVNSGAMAINNSGQVLVNAQTGSGSFLWSQASGLIDIGSLGGGSTGADAINDAGQIVGRSTTTSGDVHPFLWSPGTGMIDLAPVLGAAAFPNAINSLGHITGFLNLNPPSGTTPFLLTGAAVNMPGQSLGHPTSAGGINDADQIAASSTYSANGLAVYRALLWSSSAGYVDIGTLGGSSSTAYALNNSGQVVGWSLTAAGRQDAYIWDSVHGMQDLGIFPGTRRSIAESLNGFGEVVGTADLGILDQDHAFLWTQTDGMEDLGITGVAWSINNSGEIVGTQIIPEPSTLALMVIGSIATTIAGGCRDALRHHRHFTTRLDL